MSERSLAMANGDIAYFTGRPCKNGHVSDRQTSNGVCRECSRHISSKYASANPEKRREYKGKNRGRIEAADRLWREKNKDRIKEVLKAAAPARLVSQRSYYDKNRADILSYRKQWYEDNKEAYAEYGRNRYARMRLDPEFRLAKVLRQTIRRMLIEKCGISTFELVGYKPEDLKRHMESLWTEGMSWENYGEWHIDHIMPLSVMISRGEKRPSVINALSNLQPLWAAENISKGCKVEGSSNA